MTIQREVLDRTDDQPQCWQGDVWEFVNATTCPASLFSVARGPRAHRYAEIIRRILRFVLDHWRWRPAGQPGKVVPGCDTAEGEERPTDAVNLFRGAEY